MTPASLLLAVFLAILSGSPPQSRPAVSPPVGRPHLVLYLVDGLTSTELPPIQKSRPVAPNVNGMMLSGYTFLCHYAVSPWTPTSVASLMTSLSPGSHTVMQAGERLPVSAETLAEVLRENGYETALFTAHPLVGPLTGLDQGFDSVQEVPGPFASPAPKGPGETSATLNARALSWLDGRKSPAPFFLVIVSEDLQQPFGAPDPEGTYFLQPEEADWYRSIRRKLLAIRPGGLNLATGEDLKRLKVDPDRFAAAARALYDGAIFYNDRQFRALEDGLQERGFLEKTLLVFTSTHGEEFGEHGLFGHGPSLYDSSIRVPLVMAHPGLWPRPDQVRIATDHVDLAPTLLSLMGVPVPSVMQGLQRNLPPDRATSGVVGRPAHAETIPAGKLPTGRAAMTTERGRKLIVYQENPSGIEHPEIEFFWARNEEAWEKQNLITSVRPRILSQMRQNLRAWQFRKGGPLLERDRPPPPNPRLQDALRSLGYLQGLEPLAGSSPAPPSRKKGKGIQ